MIYLDNASTTQVDTSVKNLIDKYLYENYGNAGSVHSFGAESKRAVDVARNQIATSLITSQENVIFTSCGSEANTLAIVGLANHLQSLNLNHIITTKYEHHSVLNAMKEMERRGFEVTYLDVPNGLVQFNDFVAAVRDDTGLVSIMYVNNELGTKNDIKPIYEFCKKREILFHSDCVQAIGTETIELGKTADMVSISGHKIHAPKGVGCLCTLYKDFLSNTIFGGQQEFGIRPGTENVASIVAFGQAMQNLSENKEQISTRIDVVSLGFGGRLLQLSEELGFKFECNTSTNRNTSKILSLRFNNIDAETLVIMLGERGVCVSAGSACSSHSSEPSHALKAIGLTDEQARSTIRVSFSEYNTVAEAHEAAEIVADCVSLLSSIGEEEV
ncbi:MAG: cysteine desulfurase [Clostridia bacterium]|nr:cysteine desulfurase [Clostridia bacterium]MBQ7044498.1 cysteine desulfurase [Clostridia bacterium]